eukprot:gene11690-13121_t
MSNYDMTAINAMSSRAAFATTMQRKHKKTNSSEERAAEYGDAERRADWHGKPTSAPSVQPYRTRTSTSSKPTTNTHGKYDNMKCFLCGHTGHRRKDCPALALAKKQLEQSGALVAVTTCEIHQQPCMDLNDDFSNEAAVFCNTTMTSLVSQDLQREETMEYAHDISLQSDKIKDEKLSEYDVLYDCQSEVHVFGNPHLLKNIRPARETLRVNGVGGGFTVSQVGDYGPIGEVFYHPNCIANVLCGADLRDHHGAGYSNEGDFFYMPLSNERDNSMWIFKRKGKHYAMDGRRAIVHRPDEPQPFQDVTVLVDTVTARELRYTKREVQKAREALDLHRSAGLPSVAALAERIRNGAFLNSDVTLADIRRMVELYGEPLGNLKGKTVRRPPPKVAYDMLVGSVNNIVREIVLAIDIFFVGGLAFLLSISNRLNLMMVRYLPNRQEATIRDALNRFLAAYQARSFRVTTVLCDGEKGVQSLAQHLESR